MSYTRIEPRQHFDKAIHKERKDGYIIYDYWGMVRVCERLYDLNAEDATEWVEYNILGLNDSIDTYFGVWYEDVDAPAKVRKVRRELKVRAKVRAKVRKVGRVRKVGKKVGKRRAR